MHTDTNWKNVQMTGQVSRDVLESMFDRIIDKYLKLDCYYRIDNKPVFSIFDYPNLIKGLGGSRQAADAVSYMRNRSVQKGLPGLDVQAIARFKDGRKSGESLDDYAPYLTARELGFDGATSYQYCMGAGGEGDYVAWAHKAMSRWHGYEKAYGTFYPHVSIGWDDTHRNPSVKTAVTGSTPHAFEACLWKARQYADSHPGQHPLITINSWNEWTEGSYLLPDMRWGYRYLEAVRNVFAKR